MDIPKKLEQEPRFERAGVFILSKKRENHAKNMSLLS